MMSPFVVAISTLILPLVSCAPTTTCALGTGSQCDLLKDWNVGLETVNPSGTVVFGHANSPSVDGFKGNVHGSHVFGGPHNGAQTVGGGFTYQSPSGLHGGVDATHSRGQGNSYTGTVGGSTAVGPGTLTIEGGAGTVPGSSRVEGQVGATYTIPLDK